MPKLIELNWKFIIHGLVFFGLFAPIIEVINIIFLHKTVVLEIMMPIADMDMLLLFHADMYLVVVVLLWLGKGLVLKQNPFGGIFSITNIGLIKRLGLNIYMLKVKVFQFLGKLEHPTSVHLAFVFFTKCVHLTFNPKQY